MCLCLAPKSIRLSHNYPVMMFGKVDQELWITYRRPHKNYVDRPEPKCSEQNTSHFMFFRIHYWQHHLVVSAPLGRSSGGNSPLRPDAFSVPLPVIWRWEQKLIFGAFQPLFFKSQRVNIRKIAYKNSMQSIIQICLLTAGSLNWRQRALLFHPHEIISLACLSGCKLILPASVVTNSGLKNRLVGICHLHEKGAGR